MELVKRGPKVKYPWEKLSKIGDNFESKATTVKEKNSIRTCARHQGMKVSVRSIVGGGCLVTLIDWMK